MPRLNYEAVQTRLDEVQRDLPEKEYHNLQLRLKNRGLDVDTYELMRWCRLLQCLPTNIVEVES